MATGFLVLLNLLCRQLVTTSGHYEEDLLQSMPIRNEQWDQVKAYIASLSPRSAMKLSPERSHRALARMIGSPPPGFLNKPEGPFKQNRGQERTDLRLNHSRGAVSLTTEVTTAS